MHKPKNILAACLFVSLLSSCASATDDMLLPPTDTKWVNVEIKNPSPYTKPFPLEVVYISHKCMKSRINGVDGSREEKPAYNPVKIPLQQQESSNIWHAKVAMNGGGSCEWKLSEFNLGIEYIDATHLGVGIVPGAPVGASFAFDDIAARNGQFDFFSGSISLSPVYFPVIQEENSPDKKMANLFGKDDFISMRSLKNLEDITIKYNPFLNEKKITRMIAPKENKHGVFYTFIYPDGTLSSDGAVNPSFDKVNNMKIK